MAENNSDKQSQFGFRMPMMAPPLQFSGARATIPPQHTPVQAAENPSGKKKNRWSDTEEKILIELFGENEDKLRYKSYTSPDWASITRQLRERCQRENVFTDKNAQQCKNKMRRQPEL